MTVTFQVRVDPTLREPRTIVNQAEVTAIEIAGSILTDDPSGDGPTQVSIESPAPGIPVEPLQPEANPVTGDQVTIRFVADSAPVRLSIFNLTGERVREFGGLPAAGEVTWSLDNEAGRSVANSTYILVLQSPSSVRRGKLVVTR
jgi:hypothetical protein